MFKLTQSVVKFAFLEFGQDNNDQLVKVSVKKKHSIALTGQTAGPTSEEWCSVCMKILNIMRFVRPLINSADTETDIGVWSGKHETEGSEE